VLRAFFLRFDPPRAADHRVRALLDDQARAVFRRSEH
jgi:hypothetical protein